MSRWKLTAATATAAAFACSGLVLAVTSSGGAAGPTAKTAAVAIQNGGPCGQIFCFTPQTMTVTSGTTVTWDNQTSVNHTVTRCTTSACPVGPGTGSDAAFGSGLLGAGQTFAVTFHGLGTYNYYCQVHGYSVMHGTVTVVAPLKITTSQLPAGKVGATYSASLTASGGIPPYKWKVTQGSLPAGLTLSSSGSISGTPTAKGTSSFHVQVSDSGQPTNKKSKNLSMTVSKT
jgi:large repetitive protein